MNNMTRKVPEIRDVIEDIMGYVEDCEAQRDGDCEENPWEDHAFEFHGPYFRIRHTHSCDGIEKYSVFYRGKMVYFNDSYDYSEPKILEYIPGEWEEALREQLSKLQRKR